MSLVKKLKALVIVDLQNDFLPGGALEVPEGDMIVKKINDILDNYDLIIATKDWHPKDHISFASKHKNKDVGDVINYEGINQILWPDHCIQKSPGSELTPKNFDLS